MFLKNYIYIILLFYREPYQKYKILTKTLQYIKITSIFCRSIGKSYIHTKNIFIDIYTVRRAGRRSQAGGLIYKTLQIK